MKAIASLRLFSLFAVIPAVIVLAFSLDCAAAPTVEKTQVKAPVTITESDAGWTMDNGIIKAFVSKKNTHVTSLIYHGIEIMGPGGIWESTPGGKVTQAITIDPTKNGGERGEIAIKGVDGKMDIEIRYTLERGVSGFYTYAEYTHPATYPAAGFGENRFILQMKPTFDWLSVDADRNMLMASGKDTETGVVVHAKEQRILSEGIYKNSVEHKYSYCAEMYKLPAYGWSSTKDHIGVYFINPSTEYIGGGAAKLDLVCHLGATLLDYWTSGHYAGGACCAVPAGEDWKKVVGPIFVYLNALENPKDPSKEELDTLKATEGNPTIPPTWHDNATALFDDAIARAKPVKAAWPFEWVNGVDYPHKDQRANVTGQLVLKDPQAASTKLPHLTVGLSHPDYTGNGSAFARRSGNGDLVTWEHDGNYYQFWTDGTEDGKFDITNVRPGTYTMHAFADGVLGEYAQTDIKVEAGKNLDLGKLDWKPVRYGKQLWEIGFPTRYADKFLKGDGANYWLWGWCMRYSLLFPNDITYTIGKSDYRKDWFFEQVPHSENHAWLNPNAKDPANQRFGWVKEESLKDYPQTNEAGPWRVYGKGRATTWTIKFDMEKPSQGQAALRVALAGSDGGGGLEVGVNGKSVGTIQTISTNALRYNTNKGVWRQYTQTFDASLLKPGENTMTLTVPAGDLTTGVVYDYLRLELNDEAKPDGSLKPVN